MKYQKIVSATFIARPNRFVAQVLLGGREVSVHVKNTGRCRELLVADSVVYLEDFTDRQGKRKLLYDLVAVRKGNLLINMDSQAPNRVAGEALKNGSIPLPGMAALTVVRPEQVYGDSRFDFYVEDENGEKGYVEVKGVTLEHERVAAFPDAPTERGVKHLHELVSASENGFHSYLLFVIQMAGMRKLIPNDVTHRQFGEALRYAAERGVHILAYECAVTPDSLNITNAVPIALHGE